MTNAIAPKQQGGQVTPWGAFADENLAPAIAGDLLKFVKGPWYRGEAKALVPEDARFLVNMHEIWTGWVRWEDRKPVEHRIERLIDFPPQLRREDLGNTDKSQWEEDAQGNPKDPWSPTDRVVMRDVKSGDLVTFSTSSDGGRRAIAKLCGEFDRHARENGDIESWPMVQLSSESYEHREHGEVKKPVFKITGWRCWDDKRKRPEVTADDPRTQVKDALAGDEIPF